MKILQICIFSISELRAIFKSDQFVYIITSLKNTSRERLSRRLYSLSLVWLPNFVYRLIVLWRVLYEKTLWYQTQLSQRVPEGDQQLTEKMTHEASTVKSLLCHIQANLQTVEVCLNKTLELKSINGQYLINNF